MINLLTNEYNAAILGGLLIGIACTLNFYWFGRIPGMSGIFNTLFKFNQKAGFFWKFCFFVGLITVPQYFYWKYGREVEVRSKKFVLLDTDSFAIKHLSLFGWVLGGVLVGFGTRMSNGDTTSHAICGIPRRQARSFIATCTFIITAVGLCNWRMSNPFLQKGNLLTSAFDSKLQLITQGIALAAGIYFCILMIKSVGSFQFREYALSYILGCLFGAGLLISGMCRPSKYYDCFNLDLTKWDPSVAIAIGTAICFNFLFFPMIQGRNKPLFIDRFAPHPSLNIDFRLIMGAAMYGLGLGLTGITPGTGLINFFVMSYAVFWVCGLLLGQICCDYFNTHIMAPYEKVKASAGRVEKSEVKIS